MPGRRGRTRTERALIESPPRLATAAALRSRVFRSEAFFGPLGGGLRVKVLPTSVGSRPKGGTVWVESTADRVVFGFSLPSPGGNALNRRRRHSYQAD